ncbi:Uncharacterised protein [Streptomyces griseus]|uniref:Uncharacterized protein n=1 Tax=Streptomyces griseus TaxID=1911 RepID=A0A380PBV7_STRGR|nr:Uncharacterised protein [Streptomyces griseus]
MTAVDDRPITGVVDSFEGLEVPEGHKAELLRGDIALMAGPDLVHNRIVTALRDQIPYRRRERLRTQDIGLLKENSEPQPGLVVLNAARDRTMAACSRSSWSPRWSRSSPAPASTGTTATSGRSTRPGAYPVT